MRVWLRTWCGGYAPVSMLLTVLLGWVRLLISPMSWGAAVRGWRESADPWPIVLERWPRWETPPPPADPIDLEHDGPPCRACDGAGQFPGWGDCTVCDGSGVEPSWGWGVHRGGAAGGGADE